MSGSIICPYVIVLSVPIFPLNIFLIILVESLPDILIIEIAWLILLPDDIATIVSKNLLTYFFIT